MCRASSIARSGPSSELTWLKARIAGPVSGTCSAPRTRTRHAIRTNGAVRRRPIRHQRFNSPPATSGMLASGLMDALAFRDLVAARRGEFVDALEHMVNIDCGSFSPAGVDRVGDLCATMFRASGWMVE